MISDVLLEALTDIKRYRDNPVFHHPVDWPAMDNLLAEMEAMRRDLDTPSVPDRHDH
jgi:hypothetical protein